MADEWVVKYWPPDGKNDVERWFGKLTKEQQKSVTKIFLMLKISGNTLKLPHSRSLG
jgi:hypothetical protein